MAQHVTYEHTCATLVSVCLRKMRKIQTRNRCMGPLSFRITFASTLGYGKNSVAIGILSLEYPEALVNVIVVLPILTIASTVWDLGWKRNISFLL